MEKGFINSQRKVFAKSYDRNTIKYITEYWHGKAIEKDGKNTILKILGYYGYRNSGDDAILKSIIEQFKQNNEELSIVVLSNNPYETRTLYRVQSVHRFHPFTGLAILFKTAFIARGTLIQMYSSRSNVDFFSFFLQRGMSPYCILRTAWARLGKWKLQSSEYLTEWIHFKRFYATGLSLLNKNLL